MKGKKRIKTALISVFHKDGLEPIVRALHAADVNILSTGGTQKFIHELGIPVSAVEDLTTYPSILGGRVKTLHPKVFGGILGRRELKADVAQMADHEIPTIDLVVVDLYPFEETVSSGASEADIIEKIDIGGIALIRAASKNHNDVVIISSRNEYPELQHFLDDQDSHTGIEDRRRLAAKAFGVSSRYDSAIYNWMSRGEGELRVSAGPSRSLRYGENPHQNGRFHGDLDAQFEQLHGKELSYNNLLDLDAALELIDDMSDGKNCAFAVTKHNNACGAAIRSSLKDAWDAALAGDPVSAFGGVLISDKEIDAPTAKAIDEIFFEVIAAPGYAKDALSTLQKKKNRIILRRKHVERSAKKVRTVLNGILEQDADRHQDKASEMKVVTKAIPSDSALADLEFAACLVKHTKSNAIVLAKNKQLLASGTGQTSRVDALQQAISKAKNFYFDLHGAVMASDAFFPFPDCVEIAYKAGITAVVQPGGSIRDKESIEYCDKNGVAMVLTGYRHFKH